jgi:hypothetical protein
MVHQITQHYRGEGKTNLRRRRDLRLAWMRHDPQPSLAVDETSTGLRIIGAEWIILRTGPP